MKPLSNRAIGIGAALLIVLAVLRPPFIATADGNHVRAGYDWLWQLGDAVFSNSRLVAVPSVSLIVVEIFAILAIAGCLYLSNRT